MRWMENTHNRGLLDWWEDKTKDTRIILEIDWQDNFPITIKSMIYETVISLLAFSLNLVNGHSKWQSCMIHFKRSKNGIRKKYGRTSWYQKSTKIVRI